MTVTSHVLTALFLPPSSTNLTYSLYLYIYVNQTRICPQARFAKRVVPVACGQESRSANYAEQRCHQKGRTHLLLMRAVETFAWCAAALSCTSMSCDVSACCKHSCVCVCVLHHMFQFRTSVAQLARLWRTGPVSRKRSRSKVTVAGCASTLSKASVPPGARSGCVQFPATFFATGMNPLLEYLGQKVSASVRFCGCCFRIPQCIMCF